MYSVCMHAYTKKGLTLWGLGRIKPILLTLHTLHESQTISIHRIIHDIIIGAVTSIGTLTNC